VDSEKKSDLINIRAVHDKDIRSILDKFGLSKKIDDRELLCEFCSKTVTWDEIGALLVKNGKIVVCCKFLNCINAATNLKKDGTV
jgi:hypothetical protein